MEVKAPCDYCGENPVVTTCEVCGSKVCAQHDREHGCEICKGGEQKF